MLKEFKEFIAKGNIIDLAVGVIIGGAFGKIVASLVNDIIMPVVGLILGNVDFKTLQIILKPAEGETPALAINYGMFIQNIVDFLIIALVIFFVLKALMKVKKEKAAEEPAPAEPVITKDQELLTEIRDLLKK
ncbi:large-conductance mechanosensitive channel protein MscL [Streptobacillus felis]|uniref:Large-conductance mechanosensitive channel n=1 Tax=Streptobacillus felis TaxID=1384509 RepID=A0A7Z0T9W9_9FUSO|nr:large-conductance mechanosensitive channel protein MscL [Streptobacillus felis]NYV27440.1 large-conductance mechanosensitive channel protein MscL [Streptobacillus felis]